MQFKKLCSKIANTSVQCKKQNRMLEMAIPGTLKVSCFPVCKWSIYKSKIAFVYSKHKIEFNPLLNIAAKYKNKNILLNFEQF